jgi:hypothetical protein
MQNILNEKYNFKDKYFVCLPAHSGIKCFFQTASQMIATHGIHTTVRLLLSVPAILIICKKHLNMVCSRFLIIILLNAFVQFATVHILIGYLSRQ